MTKEQILDIARKEYFVVHKYRHSQDNIRKKCRKLKNEGLLDLVGQDRDYFYFRARARIQAV